MQHHRVNRVSLLKFKQQLLHGLDGVVTTQVDHYLLNLETDEKHSLSQCENEPKNLRDSKTVKLLVCPYIRKQCGVTADSTQTNKELQRDSQIVAPFLIGH